MTSLILFSEQPLIRALGWSLLHFLWEGAIVAVLLTSVLRLLCGRSPQLRYTAACCALVLMVILPLITFGYLATNSYAADHAFMRPIVEKNQVLSLHSDLNGTRDPWVNQIAASFDHSLPWVLTAWFAGVIVLLGQFADFMQIQVLDRQRQFTFFR